MTRKKAVETVEKIDDETNDLAEMVKMLAGDGLPKPKPKQTVAVRCDPDLYKEAKKVFGTQVGKVFEAALRQALKERKKL